MSAAHRQRRTIAVLTTGRQDWGILRSTCVAIRDEAGLSLQLVVGGMHLSARHGRTVDLVRADGFEPAAEIGWLDGRDDQPPDHQAATALDRIGAHLRATDPDALVLVGDRLETAAAAMAATLDRVPIAHVHGGEQTLGAFDDALRHAITKMSHLHLVSSDEHARRVIAMGEDPATVHVIGPPATDAAFRDDLPDRSELSELVGLDLTPPVVIVTVHPVTLDADPASAAAPVVAAMDRVDARYVVTVPNTDPGGGSIRRALEQSAGRPGRVVIDALGERAYWGLLRVADAMLGNSSSGLIEAPVVRLPVVNVGDRQAGRARQANVVDAPPDADAVTAALRRVLEPGFRVGLAEPDGRLVDGHVGRRAAHIIAAWRPSRPPRKALMPIVS